MPKVYIPSALRPFTEGESQLELQGANVSEILSDLAEKYPGVKNHLFNEAGELRNFVNIFINDEDIRFLDKKDTTVAENDEVSIVPSVAGGSNNGAVDLSKEEIARYSRHLILPEVGMEGQKKLKAASVLCIGTGGLGSPLLLYLAAAGVGRLGIVDFDVVDESNLQRQIIHGTSDVGKPKVQSAVVSLKEINPNVQIDVYEEAFTSDNAIDLVSKYDVVADGTDNFPTRYLVNDACVIAGKPNVYGSIFRFEGQASVFNYQDGPNYRDLYPEPPPPGMVPSCAEGGVLGILPGIIGLIQATEAVKIILGKGKTLSGRLMLYDALNMSFREMKVRKDPDRKPITELIDYQEFCGVPHLEHEEPEEEVVEDEVNLTPAQFKKRLESNNTILLDVREPMEWEIGHIDGATLIPLRELPYRIEELDDSKEVLVYCKVGGRSATALDILHQAGFESAKHLAGGILAWSDEVDPNIPKY